MGAGAGGANGRGEAPPQAHRPRRLTPSGPRRRGGPSFVSRRAASSCRPAARCRAGRARRPPGHPIPRRRPAPSACPRGSPEGAAAARSSSSQDHCGQQTPRAPARASCRVSKPSMALLYGGLRDFGDPAWQLAVSACKPHTPLFLGPRSFERIRPHHRTFVNMGCGGSAPADAAAPAAAAPAPKAEVSEGYAGGPGPLAKAGGSAFGLL